MDKIHGVKHKFNYKQRREKIYVCEDCGHSTHDVREHYKHSREHQAARSNTQPQSLPMMA
jgi:ovo-like protein